MSSTPVDHFKCDVRAFDDIDSQIKTIRDQIKPLNLKVKGLMTKRKELQSGICTFMAENEIDACNLPSGKLEYKETKAVKPINKAYILEKLEDFFEKKYSDEFKKMNPEEKAGVVHLYIYSEREYTPEYYTSEEIIDYKRLTISRFITYIVKWIRVGIR